MLRKMILASAVALPFGLLGSISVMAQSGPVGSGDYVPKTTVPFNESGPAYHGPVDCVTARKIVRREGYEDVEAQDCSGDIYTFRAERNGRQVLLRVDKEDGRIMRGAG